MGFVLGRGLIGAILFVAALSGASIATAQSFPIPVPLTKSTTDANGVDLAKGQIAITETDLSIGPQGAGGLAHTRFWSADTTGGGWRHRYLLAISQSATGGFTLSLGDHSVSFSVSGSVYHSDQSDGSTLTTSGNLFIYTARDGTVITFDTSIVANNRSYYGRVRAVATSIVRPSGEKITLSYLQGEADRPISGDTVIVYVARLTSVASSAGFQLSYAYASEDPNDVDNWYRITQVAALNTALCNPTVSGCAVATVNYSTAFAQSNVIESVADPAGRVKSYTTGAVSHQMFGLRRPSSPSDTLVIGYGSDGRVSSVSNGSASWTYAWSLSGTTLTGTITQPLSRVRVVTADSTKGLVLSDRDALNHTTSFTYDQYGRQATVSAPEGNNIKNTYDGRGNLVTQLSTSKLTASGRTTITTSSSFPATCVSLKTCNQPTSTTDALGNVTSYTYDPNHGGVLTVTSPAPVAGGVSPQTRFTYTQLNPFYANGSGGFAAAPPIYKLTATSTCQTTASCAGTTDEIKTTYVYGAPGVANSLVPTIISKGAGDGSLTATTTLTYDSIGNVVSADGPLPGAADTTVYAYNPDRQVTQFTTPDPDGGGPLKPRSVQYGYSVDGQVTSVMVGTAGSDGSGFVALQQGTTGYDLLGRKVADSVSAAGTTYALTQYSYDAANRLDCVAVRMNRGAFSAEPAVCALSSDGGFGPDRITRYAYDAADQQTMVTTGYASGAQRNEIAQTWSANGKPLTLVDAVGNRTTYTYDGFDRLATTAYPSVANGSQSSTSDFEALTYDADSRVTQRRLRDGLGVTYTYDALNRITLQHLPGITADDTDISYSYDNLGRLLLAAKNATNQTHFGWDALGRKVAESNYYYANTSQYDLAGRRTRLTYSDGFFLTYDYLLTGEMSGIHENGAASGVGLLATFAYDDLGRRTTLMRGNGTTTSYSYDPASRLTGLGFGFPGATANTMSTFAYNPSGQITSRTHSNDAYAWTGAYNIYRRYLANSLNQYQESGGQTLGYDGRGNLITAGSTSYGYTSLNRLTSAPGTTLYADSLERTDYISAEQVVLGHDGSDMISENSFTGAVGPLVRRYVFGPGVDEPLVWYEGAGTADRRFLHADERGSIVAVSNSAGSVMAINAYDEYGIPQSTNQGRFQYTGQVWIPSLGMYDFKARTYSPTLGRFLQTDPIGYGDGPNMYNYAHADPVNGSDPSGLDTGSLINTPGGGLCGSCSGFSTGNVSINGAIGQTTEYSDPNTGDHYLKTLYYGDGLLGSSLNLSNDVSGGFRFAAPATALRNSAESLKLADKSKLGCLGSALYENKTGLGLDVLGVAANLALPEGSVAAAIAGSTIGLAGIGAAVIDNKGPADAAIAGTLAYTGKQAAVAEGLLRGAGSALGHRIGVYALGASIAYDAVKIASDYNKCLVGQ